MDWAIDTMDLAQEPILESAQEYQDDDVYRYVGQDMIDYRKSGKRFWTVKKYTVTL